MLTRKPTPSAFRDEFRNRLVKVIKDRMAEGGHVAHRPGREVLPPEATTNVVDFPPQGGASSPAARPRSVRPRVPGGKQIA